MLNEPKITAHDSYFCIPIEKYSKFSIVLEMFRLYGIINTNIRPHWTARHTGKLILYIYFVLS